MLIHLCFSRKDVSYTIKQLTYFQHIEKNHANLSAILSYFYDMQFQDLVRRIVIQFVEAWNKGDINSMYDLMHTEIIYTSPLISPLKPEYADNTIIGRDALRDYLTEAFHRSPAIVLDMKTLVIEKNQESIHIQSQLIDARYCLEAFMNLNEYGKVKAIKLEYPFGPYK